MSASRKRRDRLRRVLKVQGQKRRIEEWSLVHLREERAAIDEAERTILQSLDPTSQLHGLFIEAKVRTLRRNDLAREENTARREENEARLLEARRREKGVERQLRQSARTVAGEEEASERDGQVESFLARLAASLG